MPGAEDLKKDQPGADDPNDKPAVDPKADPNEPNPAADDDLADPEKVKALLKSLRDENAKHRIKNKENATKANLLETKMAELKKLMGEEGDTRSPEEQAAALKAENDGLKAEIQISQISREHDIPKEHDKYFRFLLAQKFEGLKEGEELDEKDLEEVVTEVKALAAKKNGNATGLNSSNKPAPDAGAGALTVEQFVAMNMGERSALYSKNQAEYNRLFSAAKEKKLL